MNTNDLVGVDSLDLEQSQHVNDGPIALKEMLLLFTRLLPLLERREALWNEGPIRSYLDSERERRDQSLSLSTE